MCIDNDIWDLVFSVGVIVIMIVIVWVLVSRVENFLINDLFVELLVCVVGIDLFIWLVSGELRFEDIGDYVIGGWWMIDNIVIWIKFYDDFFGDVIMVGIW